MVTVMSEDGLREGGITFDWAIPHEWFARASKKAGFNLSGHVVWAYPKGMLFGEPVALTKEVADKLGDTNFWLPEEGTV